ncbi:MAG: hypothetical protein JSW47_15205, partial [Phycisphaerales bacterium]
MRAAAIKNAIVATIILSVGMAASTTLADESPDLSQAPGEHSTLSTSDGKIRDDELVDYIVEQIILNGGKVKDVKIIVNCCFGGGLLDEFQRAFGPGGPLEGTPWVAGAASEADQRAWGWSDAKVSEFPTGGSTFTDAVVGPATSPSDPLSGTARDRTTDNVKEDLEAAAIFDATGSYGQGKEDAVIASGNGGENITWNGAGGGHQAVVFGGKQNRQRHHNNIKNVKEALEELWSGDPHTIRDIDGGTTQDLKNAIAAACQNLDENT